MIEIPKQLPINFKEGPKICYIQLTNRIALGLSLVCIPYVIFFGITSISLGLSVIPFSILFLLTVLINHFRYPNWARIHLVICLNMGVVFFATTMGKNIGIQMLLFAFVGIPATIWDWQEKKQIYFGMLLPIVSFAYLILSDYKGVWSAIPNLGHANFIYNIGFFTVLIIVISYSLLFLKSIKEHEEKLRAAYYQLEEKKKQDAELAIAKDISLKMIQKDWPRKGPVIMDYVYHPATHASGDYLMTKQFSDHEHAILIADVAGHGLPACLMMTSLKSLISTIIYRGRTPAEMLNMLNSLVYHSEEITKQAPVLCGMINTDKMTFTYANGGHQEGYVFSPTTDKFKKLKSGGLPIGMFHNAKYEEHVITLHPNDVIIFFTDGLNEGRNLRGTPFGIPKLKAKIRKHLTHAHYSTLATKLHRSFIHFNENQPTKDDITILTAWIRP